VALYTRYISLYTGSGQLDKGFERGIIELGLPEPKPICYVEREFQAASLLVDKIQAGKMGKAPVWTDSSTFDSKPFIGKVDAIIGGFPCTPFSVAGNQKGEEDERWLWEDIKRLAIQVRPKFLFLENVPGIISGRGLHRVLSGFAEIGFNAEWVSIQAKHVGASHKRERLFILAYSDCKRLERKNNSKARRSTSGPGRSFPPGRNIKQWEHIIKKRPDLAPTEIKSEVCGVVNGVGRRLDSISRIGQLRLLGNGVVPQQATAALKILFNRL